MDQKAETPVDRMSFEEALAELEQVVDALEGRDGKQVPLEQSIDLYERGEALRKVCEARLREAQMRVDRIVAGPDGEASGTAPLDAKPGAPAGPDDDIPF